MRHFIAKLPMGLVASRGFGDRGPMRTSVTSPEIAPPAGPYSHAVVATGDLVYLSGQTGQDPSTGEIVSGGVAAETRQALDNLAAVLRAAGLDFSSVVKCNVFLTDIDDFPAMNAVYAQVIRAPHPARATVGVTGLALGARVEIECVAVRGAGLVVTTS